MNTKQPYADTVLGVEAGQLAPAHTLGEDSEPVPRALRTSVTLLIVFAVLALTAAVHSVPGVAQTWSLVFQQTDVALEPVLGQPEVETTRMLGSLAGSDADETGDTAAANPH